MPIFLLAWFFVLARPAGAWIMIEEAYLNIQVNARGGDDSFIFRMGTEPQGWGFNDDTFSLETSGGAAEMLYSIPYPADNYHYLSYLIPAGWRLINYNCSSDNPNNSFVEINVRVRIQMENYSFGDCVFNFQKIEQSKTPVIIVPGVMGSYLYSYIDPGVEVWPAVGRTVIDPWDTHLNQLIMDNEGKPLPNTMIVPPQDIIRTVLGKDFFAGLIEELKQNGYEEGKDLFVFPYDWRLDLNWSASGIPYSGFESLKEKIEKVRLETGA